MRGHLRRLITEKKSNSLRSRRSRPETVETDGLIDIRIPRRGCELLILLSPSRYQCRSLLSLALRSRSPRRVRSCSSRRCARAVHSIWDCSSRLLGDCCVPAQVSRTGAVEMNTKYTVAAGLAKKKNPKTGDSASLSASPAQITPSPTRQEELLFRRLTVAVLCLAEGYKVGMRAPNTAVSSGTTQGEQNLWECATALDDPERTAIVAACSLSPPRTLISIVWLPRVRSQQAVRRQVSWSTSVVRGRPRIPFISDPRWKPRNMASRRRLRCVERVKGDPHLNPG